MQAFLLLSAPTMSGLRPPLSATKKYLTVFFLLVRVERVGLSSYPWEGYIIAVIRHPRKYIVAQIEFRLIRKQKSSPC